MAEQLQNLLDRIQQDGVGKADEKAKEIITAAEQKAASIVEGAEKKAAESLKKADEEAKLYEERSKKALEQAARDIVLTVGNAVGKTLDSVVAKQVKDSLTADLVKEMLLKIAAAYGNGGTVEIAVSEDDKAALADFFTGQLASAIQGGVEIASDSNIVGGFQVSMKDKNVSHDFSDEAIAEALCKLVRPKLAEIIRAATAG